MSAVYEHHLPNGLTLLCCRQPHLHSVSFGLYLKGGSLYETEETQGVCHLLEHLCFRRLGELDHDKLSQLQCRMGAELCGATYPEAVTFTMSALPRFFYDVLHLYHRFFDLAPWDEALIEKEKQVVLRQLEEADDGDFEDEVERRYRETVYGAFPVMGTKEVIEALDAQTIHRWQRLVFQPQNACLCLSGNFSRGMEEVAVAVMSDVKNTTPRPPFEQAIPFDFCHRDERSDFLREEEGGLAKVHLAFDIDPERVFPVVDQVLDAITGGNVDSILFQTLREQDAMVAEIESYVEALGSYRRLVIRYDVRQAFLEKSLRRVFEQLCRLRVYIRPVRMELMRMQFTDNLSMLEDGASAMNDMMGWAYVAGDMTLCDLEAQARVYVDLDEEDLLNAAQSVFRPENLTVSIQHDRAESGVNLPNLLREMRAKLA